MTDRAAILLHRNAQIAQIMEAHALAGVLVCNGIRENLDAWLLAAEGIPTLQPFGRLNLFFIGPGGAVTPLCAYENHPCDFPHYPLFDAAALAPAAEKGRLGVVNPACMLQVTYEAIMQAYPGLALEDVTAEFALAKARKCPAEVEGITRAAGIYDRAFGLMPWLLRAGQTEAQAVVDLRHSIGQLGAGVPLLSEDPMATTLVDLTSAPELGEAEPDSMPYPGRRLRPGDRVNVCVNGYLTGGFAAALGRCYVLGRAAEETKRLWALAVDAQDFLARRLRPGTTVRAAAAQLNQELLAPNGIAPAAGNCVFGIGCSRSEAPRGVDQSRDFVLEEHMTLVLAPRIVLPGKDPYCCMDMYRVTREGCIRLSGTPRDLVELA